MCLNSCIKGLSDAFPVLTAENTFIVRSCSELVWQRSVRIIPIDHFSYINNPFFNKKK